MWKTKRGLTEATVNPLRARCNNADSLKRMTRSRPKNATRERINIYTDIWIGMLCRMRNANITNSSISESVVDRKRPFFLLSTNAWIPFHIYLPPHTSFACISDDALAPVHQVWRLYIYIYEGDGCGCNLFLYSACIGPRCCVKSPCLEYITCVYTRLHFLLVV